jgi:hypothetical protein
MDATNTPTISFNDIDFSLILYALAALLIGGGGSYYIMKTERMVTAVGFLLASIAIFTYFGLRWFDGMKLRPNISGVIDPNTPWPPVINYCPDFLSLKQEGNSFYCVDTMGVSTLPLFTQGSTATATNGILLNKDSTAQAYAGTFITKNVTWEGIYDGRSATTRKPPFPPTTA